MEQVKISLLAVYTIHLIDLWNRLIFYYRIGFKEEAATLNACCVKVGFLRFVTRVSWEYTGFRNDGFTLLASYKLNEFKGSVAIFAIWINANESAHASDGNWIIDTFREWKWSHIEFHIGFAGSDIRLKHIHGPFSVNQHGDISAFELLDPVRAFGLHLFIAHMGLILVVDAVLEIQPFGYRIEIVVKNGCAFLKSAKRCNKPVRIVASPLLVCAFAFR
ncbi:hypothetical protein D3C78_958580 [compost metagenome]